MNNILLTIADNYFAPDGHPDADRWASYEPARRIGAMAHAKRQFERALRCAVDPEALPWSEALPEQALALLMLRRAPTAEHQADAFTAQATAEPAMGLTDLPDMVGEFAAAALRAAGWSGHVALRG